MAKLTSDIEKFLKELIEEANEGFVEIGRNDLASYFKCSPSQINYVLTTRFTPYRGYYTESRRGGGGFIKISAISHEKDEYLLHVLNNLDDEISLFQAENLIEDLYERDIIDENTKNLMVYALNENSLQQVFSQKKNAVRMDILKNMLIEIIQRS